MPIKLIKNGVYSSFLGSEKFFKKDEKKSNMLQKIPFLISFTKKIYESLGPMFFFIFLFERCSKYIYIFLNYLWFILVIGW